MADRRRPGRGGGARRRRRLTAARLPGVRPGGRRRARASARAAACRSCDGRRAARGAAERGPRPRPQDRPALHRGRARAGGRRAQPGRGRADPGHSCSRRACRASCAASAGLRRAGLPGRRAARRARARVRRRDRARGAARTADLAHRPRGAAPRSPRADRCVLAVVIRAGRRARDRAGRLAACQGASEPGRLRGHGFCTVRPRGRPPRPRPRVHGGARGSRSSARRCEALDEEVRPGRRLPRDPGRAARAREAPRASGTSSCRTSSFGPGLTNWEYGMLCELMGRSGVAPMVFNCAAPDTGNMEILAEHGTEEQKERWLQPLLDGEIRSLLLDDRARDRRLRPDRARSSRAELDGDEWVINGHKWFTSGYNGAALAIAMVVTDPDAPPHKRASMILVPIDTPGFDGRPAGAGDGPRRGPGPLGGPLRGLPRAGRQPARRARRRLRDRAGPARPGPHPPLHARDRLGRARVRADVPARARPRRRSAGRSPRSSSSRTSSRSRGWRSTRPG